MHTCGLCGKWKSGEGVPRESPLGKPAREKEVDSRTSNDGPERGYRSQLHSRRYCCKEKKSTSRRHRRLHDERLFVGLRSTLGLEGAQAQLFRAQAQLFTVPWASSRGQWLTETVSYSSRQQLWCRRFVPLLRTSFISQGPEAKPSDPITTRSRDSVSRKWHVSFCVALRVSSCVCGWPYQALGCCESYPQTSTGALATTRRGS